MKKWYVLIEVIGDGPQIRDADSWLCPWEDLPSVVHEYLEDADEDQILTLRFTQYEWTEEELAEYVASNDIEWEG